MKNWTKECQEVALKLVSIIVSQISSVEVDVAFMDLLKEDNNLARSRLDILHSLFQNRGEFSLEIWLPVPIIEFSHV
jgi:hypothetical protein